MKRTLFVAFLVAGAALTTPEASAQRRWCDSEGRCGYGPPPSARQVDREEHRRDWRDDRRGYRDDRRHYDNRRGRYEYRWDYSHERSWGSYGGPRYAPAPRYYGGPVVLVRRDRFGRVERRRVDSRDLFEAALLLGFLEVLLY